jgi:hypothetical protein
LSSLAQRSLSGGEVAPGLYARTDTARYQHAVRTMRNFIALRHGGAGNRPGTEFVREVKDSTKVVRLIEFVFNDEQTYVLEFGDHYMRVHQDGGTIVVSGVVAWATATVYTVGDLRSSGGVNYYATAAHTSGATTEPGVGASWQTAWHALAGVVYEIPTPYLSTELAALKYSQTADVITLVHPSHPPMGLTRSAHTRWVLAPIVFGPSIGQVTGIGSSGGGAGAVTYWAITAVDEATNEEGLPAIYSSTNRVPSAGTPTVLTWTPVPGAIEYYVYRSSDGTTYGLIGPAGGTLVVVTDTTWTDTNEVASSASPNAWAAAAGQVRNPLTIGATTKAFDGQYTVNYRHTLTVAAGGSGAYGRVAFYYSRDGEARVFAGYQQPSPLIGTGTLGPVSNAMTIDVPDNGYTALTIDLVPEVFPFTAHTCTMTVDTATPPDNAVAWTSPVTSFTDTAIAANLQQAPPSQQSLFNSVNNYPSAVGVYQQRRLLASTIAEPEKTWASRSASYENFATSTPLQDDDMVSWVLAGRQVNSVEHLIDLGELIVFTSGSEQRVRGDDAGILRPGHINPVKLSAHGSADQPAPLEVGDSAIYVQARGSVVRDLKPIADAGTYEGTDLTVMAGHLFEGFTIADWDYAETPNGVIWAVRSDGVLLGLTYLREHGIWGWHRHDTDGLVENVVCVPEGNEDRLYLVVNRTISGVTKRYIERMASRYFAEIDDAVFLDSALSYDGWHTGAVVVTLTGGTDWTHDELLTLTASSAQWLAGDVGNAIFLLKNGVLIRFTIAAYVSATVLQGHVDAPVPMLMQATAIGAGSGEWAKAVDSFAGLAHLEGKALSVLGDGHVVSSPNNADFGTPVVVTAGVMELGRPYAKVRAGVPYTSDLETLDIDTPSGRSVKARSINVRHVGLVLEKSRGGFVGRALPTGTDPLENMDELIPRTGFETLDEPPELITNSAESAVASSPDQHGRVAVRQVDPLPLTVLAFIPIGDL